MAYNYTPSIFDDKPSILSQLQELKKQVATLINSGGEEPTAKPITHIINIYSDSFYVGANPDEGVYAEATFIVVDTNPEPITNETLAARMFAANHKALPLQFANFPNGSYYGNCGIVVPSASEYIIYASGDYVYSSQVVDVTDTVIG